MRPGRVQVDGVLIRLTAGIVGRSGIRCSAPALHLSRRGGRDAVLALPSAACSGEFVRIQLLFPLLLGSAPLSFDRTLLLLPLLPFLFPMSALGFVLEPLLLQGASVSFDLEEASLLFVLYLDTKNVTDGELIVFVVLGKMYAPFRGRHGCRSKGL